LVHQMCRGADGADYNKMPRSAPLKAVTCYPLPVSGH
jgi:hypothetical protein